MLNEKIRKKREELNKSIEENRKYEKIYQLSIELDELIAEYYREEKCRGEQCSSAGHRAHTSVAL